MGAPFEKDRKSIEDQLLQAKREMLFSTFLATTEKRLKDEGKIKVYDKVIASALSSSESAAPKMPGGLPAGLPGGGRPRTRRPVPRKPQ